MKRLSFAFFLLLISLAHARKVGQTCNEDRDCEAGSLCQSCGSSPSRCTQIRPLDPTSKVKGQAFNKYSWLTTHNSYAITGSNPGEIAPTNQQDSVADQLKNGVRGLMLDMYDFNNDVWLCHSFGGQCYNFTAFQPAINVLKEIQAFLDGNPSEIITIFIEDYVKSPKGLTKVFDAAGLRKYWFPVSSMPKNGGHWPNIDDMISKNQRLLVFTSKPEKEASEGIAYEWRYVVENQYGDGGMKAGSCPNRAKSSPMNSTSRSLVLMNRFPDNPNTTEACMDNSASLISMLNTCYESAGNRWANFIAVDFYKKSNGGGAAKATDEANGHMLCGCDNIAYCKANASFGTCDIPTAEPPDVASPPVGSGPGSATRASGSSFGSGASVCKPLSWLWPSVALLVVLCLSRFPLTDTNDSFHTS